MIAQICTDFTWTVQVFLCLVLPVCMCCCCIICPRCLRINSYSWRTTPQAPPSQAGQFPLMLWSSSYFLLSFSSYQCLSCWKGLLQCDTESWADPAGSVEKDGFTAAWNKIHVSARDGWGISSFPSIETGVFLAQLYMLKARSERRRCSAVWALLPPQTWLPTLEAKAMDWMEASCLPNPAPGLPTGLH